MKFNTEGISHRPALTRLGLGERGIGWVDEKRHDARRRKQFAHQFQTFRQYFFRPLGHAGDVATRPVRLATTPSWTGSAAVSNTIGMVEVAAFAASICGVPVVTINAT